jgi:hypothetical protein
MELEACQQQLPQALRSASEKDTEQQREREKLNEECQLLRNSLSVYEEAKAVLEHQLAASRGEASKAVASANELASRVEDLEKQLACSREGAHQLAEVFRVFLLAPKRQNCVRTYARAFS